METLRHTIIVICVSFFVWPLFAEAGAQTYSTPGTYSFVVPAHDTLTVQVWGAGGGGGAEMQNGTHGVAGGYSAFGSVTGYGGTASPWVSGGWSPTWRYPVGGTGGSASGGTTNIVGGKGGNMSNDGSHDGGSSPYGGTGGAGQTQVYNNPPGGNGNAPGGGGGGAYEAGGGGAGGYSSRTYASGSLTPGSTVTVRVGAGGNGAGIGCGWCGSGGNGAAGRVYITWTTPVAPTCSISLSPNPVNEGEDSTLTWSSTNATSLYIQNVGYVSSSGSATVSPSQTTSYLGTATGPGGTADCEGAGTTDTLTVNQSCSWNEGSVTHGQSVTAYQNATLPYGSTCVSQARTCADGSLTGSYQYASCTVDSLPPPPTAAISAEPSIVQQNGSTTLTWSSTDADSCLVTGNNETWSGTSSPAGGQETGPLKGEVDFILSCENAGGEDVASTSVRILPSFEEI